MPCACSATPDTGVAQPDVTARYRDLLARLIAPQLCVLAWFFAWCVFALYHGLPFSTIALDPLSAVEAALHEVQLHPEEGIHALARLHLPPYTGVLHTSAGLLWGVALAVALYRLRPNGTNRSNRTYFSACATLFALAFTLALLQDTLFLTSWRSGHEYLLDAFYLLLLVAAISPALRRPSRLAAAQLLCLLAWLLLRKIADDLLPPLPSDYLERLADLEIPSLWLTYLLNKA